MPTDITRTGSCTVVRRITDPMVCFILEAHIGHSTSVLRGKSDSSVLLCCRDCDIVLMAWKDESLGEEE